MSRHRRFPSWTALSGVIAVVAVCALGFSKSATASCGDWLDQHPLPSTGEHSPPPIVPCHGPGCRQAPVSDLPTVPVPTTVQQQERLCIPSADGQLGPLTFGMLLVVDDGQASETIRDRIDRPPRP